MANVHQPLPPVVEPSEDRDRPRFAYPEALSQEDRDAMERVLPDEVTAAHLRWLETGEGDPWGEPSG